MQSMLKIAGDRFHIPFKVVENGEGIIPGTVSETEQSSQPSYVFVRPRHVFRTPAPSACRAGLVVESPFGERYIVGENGPADTWRGRLWESFRVFEPSGVYEWRRSGKIIDPITRVETTGEDVKIGDISAAIESIDREQSDREMREFFEQSRFITPHPVKQGDTLDNRVISKVDKQLGLYIGVLT